MTRREALLAVLPMSGSIQTITSSDSLRLSSYVDPPWVVHLPPTVTYVRGDQRVTFTAEEIMAALLGGKEAK